MLAAMIGLGVGIDYALFILTRFRNGLDDGLEPREAAIAAVDTAGRAVLFAGVTVIIALMGMFLLGLTFLYGVAMAAALAVLFTMIAALTLLPALLTIAGRRVDRLRIPGLGNRARRIDENTAGTAGAARSSAGPGWRRSSPAALLILLCVPTLSLRLGSNDAGTEPPETTTREAYDLLAEGFGPGFNGPFMMVAALPSQGRRRGAGAAAARSWKTKKGSPRLPTISLNPAEEHRRLPGLPDDLAAERGDDRAARPHPRRRDPADRGSRPAPSSTSAASPRSSRTSATRSPKSCRSSSASSCCSRRCC